MKSKGFSLADSSNFHSTATHSKSVYALSYPCGVVVMGSQLPTTSYQLENALAEGGQRQFSGKFRRRVADVERRIDFNQIERDEQA